MNSKDFFDNLVDSGVNFFTGIPDSLLKDFCQYIDSNVDSKNHVIAANEGSAISIAAGHYLSSNKVPLVYMQNSGLGNSVNPLASLAVKEVYKIPMILMIGWRGAPGKKDEPQHLKQGEITAQQLEILGIPYLVIDDNSSSEEAIQWVTDAISEYQSPVALLVKKGSFNKEESSSGRLDMSDLGREQAIEVILDNLDSNSPVVSTTGKTSRELYELRQKRGEPQRDFLTVGSMGHTSAISLGVLLGAKNKMRSKLVCLDGDGAWIMHMGQFAVTASYQELPLIHVILNNSAHESVGGQATIAGNLNLADMAKGCGYQNYFKVENITELKVAIVKAYESVGMVVIEVLIKKGSRFDLGRPK
jgi:phosphonopyruvate decarboxylase